MGPGHTVDTGPSPSTHGGHRGLRGDRRVGPPGTAALDNGEFTPEELRETLVMLAPYAGYPRVAPLVGVCEEAINAWTEAKGGEKGLQEG